MDTPTLLTPSVVNTGNVQSTTVSSASCTPAANKLVVVNVYVSVFSGTPPTITVSGCGLTWTSRASHVHDTFTAVRQVVYTGIAASPSTGTIDVVVAASGATECFVAEFIEIGGVDAAAPVTQVVLKVGAGSSPTTQTITLAALGAGAPGVVVAWTRANGSATSALFAASSGYTVLEEKFSNTGGNPGCAAFSYAVSGTTTPGVTSSTDFLRINGVAIEVKEAAAASTSGPPSRAFPRSVLMH